MHRFFAAIGHLFEQLDHEAVMLIHFLDAIFTGTEVQQAIGFVAHASETYVNKLIDEGGNAVEATVAAAVANTQRREWVVGSLVAAGLTETRARVLTETVVGLAKKKVDGLLEGLAAHYAAPPAS